MPMSSRTYFYLTEFDKINEYMPFNHHSQWSETHD